MMFGKIAEAKQKAEDIKNKLALISVEGKSEGVTAVFNGNRKMISIDISAELLKSENKAQIENAVQLAIVSAMEQAESLAQSEMKSLMGSMLPGGLGNLFG